MDLSRGVSTTDDPRVETEGGHARADLQDWLAELGERVADDGLAAHYEQLMHVAHLALAVSPTAASVLADVREPGVARARALAVVSAALVRAQSAASVELRTTTERPPPDMASCSAP